METYATKKTYRDYIYFLIGQSFSLLGSSIVQFAVIWWITSQTESATFLSISITLSFIPQLIMIPIAGTFSDLWDRKKLIAIADSLQALTTFGIIIFLFFNLSNIWLIIGMNTIRGVFQTFHRPAVVGMNRIMVPKEKLSRINGINQFRSSLINFVSPVLAAALMGFMTFEQILWIDIITFALALIPLIFIRIPTVRAPKKVGEKESFWKEFKLGFKTVKETKGLLQLGIWSTLINFLILPSMILLPYYIRVTNQGNEGNLAFVMAFTQVGMITASIIVAIKKNWKNKTTWILGTGILFSISVFIFAWAPVGNFILIGVGQFTRGFLLILSITIYITILQVSVPAEQQGRIFSIDNFISMLITPISMAICGPLADTIGIRTLYIICGVLIILLNGGMLFTGLTKIKYDTSEQQTSSSKPSQLDQLEQESRSEAIDIKA